LRRLIASRVFAHEEKEVVVARSREEKDMAVDCPTTVTCYNMQYNYFLSGFRK
jgi:hypothetical protein